VLLTVTKNNMNIVTHSTDCWELCACIFVWHFYNCVGTNNFENI
jgi:hypothetical protein